MNDLYEEGIRIAHFYEGVFESLISAYKFPDTKKGIEKAIKKAIKMKQDMDREDRLNGEPTNSTYRVIRIKTIFE